MTSYNFGDVVLVHFHFTDQTTNKKRPVVVISSDVYNAEYPERILMGITSQVSSSPKRGIAVINAIKNPAINRIRSIFCPVIYFFYTRCFRSIQFRVPYLGREWAAGLVVSS
ncbi:type II toxin-antitoxin system PemK/MazF family toxin [Microcoleus sp. Pol7_A1]|uniref:type II toxin-antitoxin system PemK/MazF family toxin n=1 Tax=Microcoleus sp. Pol7_A1 TaxID=2818893 RepID=UPI004040781E